MKESVIFYKSFYEAIKNLPKENQVELYDAIFEYSFTGKEPKTEGLTKAMFLLMQENIDRANARYNASVENGKKGGRPKKEKPNNNLDETQQKPNQNLNDNDNDNVNDNDNIKKESIKKESRFQKPSIDEIKQYCDERHNGINAEAFYDFYESKNWMIGKNKMKDFRAAIRTWEQRDNKKPKVLPSWYNQEIKDQELDATDKQEFDDFIKEFRNGV